MESSLLGITGKLDGLDGVVEWVICAICISPVFALQLGPAMNETVQEPTC